MTQQLKRLLIHFFPNYQELIVSYQQIAKDAGKVFFATAIAAVIGFVGSIFVVRALPIENYGLLGSYGNLTTTAAGIVASGINFSFVRYLSRYLDKDPQIAKILTRRILLIELVIGVIIFILSLFFSKFIAINFFHKEILDSYIKLAGLGALLTIVLSFFQSVIQSHQKYGFFALVILLQAAIGNILIFIFYKIGILSSLNVIYTNIATSIILILIAIIYLQKRDVFSRQKRKDATIQSNFFKDVLRYSKWLTIMSISTLIFLKLDIFMLTRMVTLTDVGKYSFAYNIYQSLLMVLFAVNTVILPKISRISKNKEFVSSAKKIFRASFVITLFVVPIFFIIKPIVILLYGTTYLDALPILYIMMIGLLVSMCLNPIVNILLIIKQERYMALINLSILFLNVIGNLIFIPLYGLMGAVIVTTTTIILSNVILVLKLISELRKFATEPENELNNVKTA